jgi:hypothetical protein
MSRLTQLDPTFHLKMAMDHMANAKPHHAALSLGLAHELAKGDEAIAQEAESIFPVMQRPIRGSSAARQYYWHRYDSHIRQIRALDRGNAKAASFHKQSYALGVLPPPLATALHKAVLASQIVPFASNQSAPGFVVSNYDPETDATANRLSRFRALSEIAQALVEQALSEIRDDVASHLETPWRVLGVKSWSTAVGEPQIGMNAWHADEYIAEIFKIMIYVTPMSRQSGTLELRSGGKDFILASPDFGTWVLFRNSDLLHRGVPGSDSERVVIEITLSRALEFDLRPRFPAASVNWPEFPWFNVLGGSRVSGSPLISAAAAGQTAGGNGFLVFLIQRFGTNEFFFKCRRWMQRVRRLYFGRVPQ